MDKKQILENIYSSASVTEEDKKRIEELFSLYNMKIRTSASDRIQDDIIRKYRPGYFENKDN